MVTGLGSMDLTERLAKERRARLAAERLLEQKSRELLAANERLALHARAMSNQIVVQRQAMETAQSEAEALKGQNLRFLSDLELAHSTAVMAERRLWDSINTIRDGFAVFDAAGRLVVANQAFRRVFGCPDIAQGITWPKVVEFIAGSGRIQTGGETAADWCQRMVARWDQDPITPEVLRLNDGNWVRLTERRARDGDIVCLVPDISEQMRIWAAIEAIPDGFVLFDKEDRLMVCNQRYRELFAESAPAMMPGATFESILRYGLAHGQFPDATGREADWLDERLRLRAEPSAEVEYRLPAGRWLRAIDKTTPDGGKLGLRLDITQTREQRAALERAREEAEAAVRAKSSFLANMSHEIRTPMNGVVGMAELLCDSALSEEQRLFAETIRSSGEALLTIINDILDYSRIEAERLTLHPEPFDLERAIHEVAMLLQPSAREKSVDIMIDYDMFLPTRFVGDPGRLRQVMTNLMGNAVKFTESGHVLVRIVGVEVKNNAQVLHVTVEDTGIGIASEHLEHIFGEFNQVESDRNRKFEGTGLGLAITRGIVERMGGAVWVESEPGRGSCFGFRLTLPIGEEPQEHVTGIDLRRALVVDGQFINRTILERQLSTCGITSVCCRNAADALALIAEDQDFDVILADQDLPDMDGIDLARAISAAGLQAPIVVLSTSPTILREHLGDAPVRALLQKPLLRADLYRRLRSFSSATSGEAPAQPAAPAEPDRQRIMRVLAAEDNRTNQLVFRKMVKDLPIELVFASNGIEALDLCETFRPDLIFMDISMPEMDGRDAALAIRASEPEGQHVPIVALTAHAMEGDAEAILAAGIDRYLTKPLRKAAICEALADFAPAEVTPPLVRLASRIAIPG